MSFVGNHNISFMNMISDFPSAIKWGEVMTKFNKTKSRDLRLPCLLNYAGNTGDEYDDVWKYSLEKLQDENSEYKSVSATY